MAGFTWSGANEGDCVNYFMDLYSTNSHFQSQAGSGGVQAINMACLAATAAVPPPPPAVTQQSTEPTCSLKLEYTGVKSLAGVVNHAAVVVTDSSGDTITMEGFPEHVLPPWGKLEPHNTAGDVGDTQWGKTLTSALDLSLCDQVNDIEKAESYYSTHEVTYIGYPGPNSNSFAHWLLESGYVDQYFTQPPRTPGWNTPLYGTILGH